MQVLVHKVQALEEAVGPHITAIFPGLTNLCSPGTEAIQPFQCHGPDMSFETPQHAGVWGHVVEICGMGDSRSLG